MHKKIFLIIVLIVTSNIHSQNLSREKQHPFSGNFVLSASSGLTLTKSDYRTDKFGINVLGSLEYFFATNSNFTWGLKAYGGGMKLKAEDTRRFPTRFVTNAVILGGGITISYTPDSKLFPYFYGGVSNFNFSPTNESDQPLPNNAANIYKKNALSIDTEIGIRYVVINNLSFFINTSFHFIGSDYIDDINVGQAKDFAMTSNVGISLSILGSKDSDGDGINDDIDACIDEPEDIDGYNDKDGCPDEDNDNDGILDINDKCPNQPEDFDGFEDSDGCPEFDNDGDGIEDINDPCPDDPEDFDGIQDNDGCPEIDFDNDGVPDSLDKCPEISEDFDGFEDDDGCPDLDNDKDGIPDKNDLCPDSPEDKDGFEDDDGCPDIKNVKRKTSKSQLMIRSGGKNFGDINKTKEISIHSDLTFYVGSADLKTTADDILQRVLQLLEKYPNAKWKIEGHMDNNGSPSSLQKLSQKRAEAVVNYLVSKGIHKTQLIPLGLGSKFPIESNSNAYGRMKNRRIVIKRIE